MTAEIDTTTLTHSDYRLKFVATNGALTAGVITAFITDGVSPPTDEWTYSYEYPSDALFAVRIGGASRQDAYDTKPPYKLYHRKKYTAGDDGSFTPVQQLLTDEDDACLEYVSNEFLLSGNSTEQIYPDDFAMAFSLRLAIAIAPRITGGDNGFLVRDIQSRYYSEMSQARGNAMNEMGPDVPLDSEFHRARE